MLNLGHRYGGRGWAFSVRKRNKSRMELEMENAQSRPPLPPLRWPRLSIFRFQFHSTFIPFPVRFYSLSFPFLVSCRISIFMNMIDNAKRQSLCELKSIDSRTGGDWKSRWISILHFRESRYNIAVCNMYIWLRLYSGWAWMYQSLFTWPSPWHATEIENKSVVQQHE